MAGGTARLVRESVVILGAALVALVSATPNAFNTISKQFQEDTGASPVFVALLLGVGVAGLQFTLPAGVMIDKVGAVRTCLAGLVAIGAGYTAMSFTTNTALLLLEYAVASLGSGTTFLCALSTAISMGYPIGIALVSVTMSLSISFTVLMDKVYGKHADCQSAPDCWRQYVRVYAVVCSAVCVLGTAALALRPESKDGDAAAEKPATEATRSLSRASAATGGNTTSAALARAALGDEAVAEAGESTKLLAHDDSRSVQQQQQQGDDDIRRPLTFRQSLRIFRRPFFVALFAANTIGLGAGILVITTALQMWEEYNTDRTKNHWNELITVYFSMFSGGFNVISPLLSDYLHSRGILRRASYLAVCLAVIGADFMVLGTMTAIPHVHHGGCHLKMAFVFLMAAVGSGFGTYLTVLLTILGDIYGDANFGRFMSYMQLGSTAFAVSVPTITSKVQAWFQSYNSLYWVLGSLLLLAAIAVRALAPRVASPTFARAATGNPKLSAANSNLSRKPADTGGAAADGRLQQVPV